MSALTAAAAPASMANKSNANPPPYIHFVQFEPFGSQFGFCYFILVFFSAAALLCYRQIVVFGISCVSVVVHSFQYILGSMNLCWGNKVVRLPSCVLRIVPRPFARRAIRVHESTLNYILYIILYGVISKSTATGTIHMCYCDRNLSVN